MVDRHVLPLIFSGNLTRWNDARLKALQPSHVADELPDEPIEVSRLRGLYCSNAECADQQPVVIMLTRCIIHMYMDLVRGL